MKMLVNDEEFAKRVPGFTLDEFGRLIVARRFVKSVIDSEGPGSGIDLSILSNALLDERCLELNGASIIEAFEEVSEPNYRNLWEDLSKKNIDKLSELRTIAIVKTTLAHYCEFLSETVQGAHHIGVSGLGGEDRIRSISALLNPHEQYVKMIRIFFLKCLQKYAIFVVYFGFFLVSRTRGFDFAEFIVVRCRPFMAVLKDAPVFSQFSAADMSPNIPKVSFLNGKVPILMFVCF